MGIMVYPLLWVMQIYIISPSVQFLRSGLTEVAFHGKKVKNKGGPSVQVQADPVV